ncbi:hypothetical protein PHYBLDRAFT_69602 [Phycomyces blakesleeanus NRRL 1555(-)]|uniref:Uncharacterized protein n=1 Tax=Phycomyces blakesleeanus (strain ATCC 8743b / DSM 1359 / FGSC 10004 / NBRC 33097 / NRRL 1555) TaxID=763407 RepID=A0A167LIZ5_PHYB8|nr:hypothetical protein PHYBLDRAFT_69602 [Phycomyces blakesleeanus NRRL 1555(-)]OAD70567.1 hypothetical protein PHYBLDRAFT_69602 [Phycomyces blakesleeanus NRRL 1555(-)]|eukprot:XP_018288607.1 hypothetical protein PHYBLDRAFT_69602 [Phycomyces blakesleeanus NRRL 1555(-)]
MNNSNLITQTSGESNDKFNINFSILSMKPTWQEIDLSSDGQYDLRDFVLEENISSRAKSMDVDIDFDQDMPTGIESPPAAINALMSHYKMNTLLKMEYTICSVTYDMYQEGCIRFDTVEAGQYEDDKEQCPHCNSQWFQDERGTLILAQTFQVVPLSEQLRFKLGNAQEQAKMTYDRNRLSDRVGCTRSDILNDNSDVVDQNDILVSMFVDQFNSFDNSEISATVVHVINLSIDPKLRYERESMIQLAIILGSKHPKHIASFLETIVEDLHMLQTSGLRIQKFSGQRYTVNGSNVFRDLNILISPAFFGLDEMHLIGYGIGYQLYNALNSKFNMSNEAEDNAVQQAVLDQQQQQQLQNEQNNIDTFALHIGLDQINSCIGKSRPDIPANFTGS